MGDFVLINGYLLQFIYPLNHFGYIIRSIRKGLNDVSSAMNLLSLKPEIKDAPHATDLKIENAEIVFDNVQFHYDERRPILKGISFTVPAGKSMWQWLAQPDQANQPLRAYCIAFMMSLVAAS